jgi:hypothetical protein
MTRGRFRLDTTESVMAYVAAHAYHRAVGETRDRAPTFDAETGIFAFPR